MCRKKSENKPQEFVFFATMERTGLIPDDTTEVILGFIGMLNPNDSVIPSAITHSESIPFDYEPTDMLMPDDVFDVDWAPKWDTVAPDDTQFEEFLHNLSADNTHRWEEVDTRDVPEAKPAKRRRLNEAERLRKFSWERIEVSTEGKRVRYTYVNNANGSTATSLRKALRECRPM